MARRVQVKVIASLWPIHEQEIACHIAKRTLDFESSRITGLFVPCTPLEPMHRLGEFAVRCWVTRAPGGGLLGRVSDAVESCQPGDQLRLLGLADGCPDGCVDLVCSVFDCLALCVCWALLD